VLPYPSGMSVSNGALYLLAESLRRHRDQIRTGWRKLSAGRQALLALAYLRKGETYMSSPTAGSRTTASPQSASPAPSWT